MAKTIRIQRLAPMRRCFIHSRSALLFKLLTSTPELMGKLFSQHFYQIDPVPVKLIYHPDTGWDKHPSPNELPEHQCEIHLPNNVPALFDKHGEKNQSLLDENRGKAYDQNKYNTALKNKLLKQLYDQINPQI